MDRAAEKISAPIKGRPAPQPALRWQVAGLCLVLAAITFAVFGQTLRHEFIDFDDNEYVYENPVVSQGLSFKGVVWAFTKVHSANWHPLTWLSHELDCQLYGLHPAGHHLTSVLLHIATVIALFLVLRQMTGALWRSAFVAAVFAIHPLRVESVAWVAERKDVLSGLFFMLTIGAYVRYVRQPWSPARYGLVLVLFAMGLMCKPMLVTLPLVLFLLDYWPLQRKESVRKLVLEKLPLLALCAASCVVTLFAQSKAMKSIEILPLSARVINAVLACKIYLFQMFYPVGLAAFYPFSRTLSEWDAMATGMVLAVISVAAWRQQQQRPWFWVGWIWYLVMLVPVVGIIQVGAQAHADRYTYLPQIGIYVALSWWAAELGAKCRAPVTVLGVFMASVIVALTVCAWKQATYWQNNQTLWSHALDCTTDNKVAYVNLGHDLLKNQKLDQAFALYQKALQVDPDDPEFHNNLGNVLRDQGKMGEAILQYEKAAQLGPAFAEAQYNLGKAYSKMGNVDGAILQYQKALQIHSNFSLALTSLGDALLEQGKTDQAIAPLQKALAFRPNDPGLHLNLGVCFLQKGRMQDAVSEYQKALQLAPDDPKTQNNLAWLLATCPVASIRNGSQAVDLARQADTLTGGKNPMILHTLAAALAEAGRFPEALNTARYAEQLAQEQSKDRLVEQLQLEMKLYQAGRAFHLPEQTH